MWLYGASISLILIIPALQAAAVVQGRKHITWRSWVTCGALEIVRNCVEFCEFPHKCKKAPDGQVIWMTIRELQNHFQEVIFPDKVNNMTLIAEKKDGE